MIAFKAKNMQYIASLLASFITLITGYNLAWPSPILEKLESDNSPIGVHLTLLEGSWVSSVMLLGVTFGNLFLGPLQDYCGRRGLLLLSTGPILISWLFILFANSFPLLLFGRFLLGVGVVVPTMTTAVYISEISEPEIRGTLGMINLSMLEVGMLLVTATGSYSTYSNAAIVGAVIPVIFYLIFFHMPESPYYYLRRGDTKNAEKCMTKLRVDNCVKKELTQMQNNVEKEMNEKSSFWEVIRCPKYRKALIIILGAKTLQQFSGTIAINSYMKTIFNEVENGLDPRQASVICTAVAIPSVFLGSYLIDKMGRKPLYCISTIGCMFALVLEFVYFFMQDYLKEDMSHVSILPFIGIILFNIFRGLGIQHIPVILLSEIFPTNIKAWGLTISLVYSSVLAFIVTMFYPLIAAAWGVYFCFLIFIVFCLLGLCFIIFVIPETKGQSLHDIQGNLEDEVKHDKY